MPVLENVTIAQATPPVEFRGELLARTQTGHALRWAEFELWRTEAGAYVVHRTGRSRVYHRADTSERSQTGHRPGRIATIDDLPDDAEPCRYCRPPAPLSLGDDEKIRFEFDRHTVNECHSAQQVVDVLTRHRSRVTQEDKVAVSKPVEELLRIAARTDPAFEQIEMPVHRIA